MESEGGGSPSLGSWGLQVTPGTRHRSSEVGVRPSRGQVLRDRVEDKRLGVEL